MESWTRPKFEDIPLDNIELSEVNVRNLKDAKKDLDTLKESMRSRGLIHPILVFPIKDKFAVVVGQRRYLAARELGWSKIPALILESRKIEEGRILSAIENLQRKELSFSDQVAIAEFLYDRFVGDHKRVAKELGIPDHVARTLLKRKMIPKAVAEMVDKKQIRKGDAEKAVQAGGGDENKVIEVAKELKKLTKDEKERFVQIAKDKPQSPPSAWFEDAKKPSKAVKVTVILLRKYATSLEQAARQRGEEPAETARIAVIDWLEAHGYA